MKIREIESKRCGECGRSEVVRGAAYGCDGCQKEIDPHALVAGKFHDHLQATVFRNGIADAETLHFCSWACALAVLRAARTDHFISLPYLNYDADVPEGQRADDFFAAIAKVRGGPAC